MDLATLLSIRASKSANLETLKRLFHRFGQYVLLLEDLLDGGGALGGDIDIEHAQHELLLRLRKEERRFLEWNDGEQMLNPDVFGLAETPPEFVENEGFAATKQRAFAKFEHLIEQAQDELNITNAEIAVVSPSHAHPVPSEAVFGAGEQYDALRHVQSILRGAKRKIQVIDGYVDERVLDLLKEKAADVTVEILTKEKGIKPAFIVAARAFDSQYTGLEVRTSDAFHDRFIIIDDSDFYHLGASIKDAGKSGFMFSRIDGREIKTTVRELWAKAWSSAKPVQ